MTTVRLPIEYKQKLEVLSVLKKKSKSELIKEALDIFFDTEESEMNSYELGKDYFGQYGSGRSDLSTTYKHELKEKFHAKYRTH
ncbi:CopG family transcriptional regulator [Treponema sp. OMZ 840]|uniref:CopG family ribbon-helix-helix protein n=1 Tax=Treponema sp. OMZ 840 TaxID=244313 RepID=UPI003D8C593A